MEHQSMTESDLRMKVRSQLPSHLGDSKRYRAALTKLQHELLYTFRNQRLQHECENSEKHSLYCFASVVFVLQQDTVPEDRTLDKDTLCGAYDAYRGVAPTLLVSTDHILDAISPVLHDFYYKHYSNLHIEDLLGRVNALASAESPPMPALSLLNCGTLLSGLDMRGTINGRRTTKSDMALFSKVQSLVNCSRDFSRDETEELVFLADEVLRDENLIASTSPDTYSAGNYADAIIFHITPFAQQMMSEDLFLSWVKGVSTMTMDELKDEDEEQGLSMLLLPVYQTKYIVLVFRALRALAEAPPVKAAEMKDGTKKQNKKKKRLIDDDDDDDDDDAEDEEATQSEEDRQPTTTASAKRAKAGAKTKAKAKGKGRR